MQPGEIHLAAFPFGDAPGMKLRPVLLLTPQIASTNEVVVAYISSVIPPTVLPTDLVLDPQREEHGQTGLKVASANLGRVPMYGSTRLLVCFSN